MFFPGRHLSDVPQPDRATTISQRLIDVDPVIAVNTPDEAVTWGRSQRRGAHGAERRVPRSARAESAGDNLRIDWGYFHLAAPDAKGHTFACRESLRELRKTGTLPASDDMDMPRTPREDAAHLAVVSADGQAAAASTVSRHVLLAYTEDYAIEYLGRKLRPYWQRNGNTVADRCWRQAEARYPLSRSAARNSTAN